MQENIASLLFLSPLYFSISQFFLEVLVFLSWIQVCPLPAGYVKLLDGMEKPLFLENLGIVSAFEGWIIQGTITALVASAGKEIHTVVGDATALLIPVT